MGPTDDDVFGFFKYINDAADIGIIAYNLPWSHAERFRGQAGPLRRICGPGEHGRAQVGESLSVFHWARHGYRLFKDRFNFIEQGGMLSLGFRLGMGGFIDTLGNVAPRYSLKKCELIREKRFDELDQLELIRFDADLNSGRRADGAIRGWDEGQAARERLLLMGMDTGRMA